MDYWGIIVKQALADPTLALHPAAEVIGRCRKESQDVLLISLPETALHESCNLIRQHLRAGCAHFFCGSKLVVVFPDAVFTASIDPTSWMPIRAHGQSCGIPSRKLDFYPHTREQARQFFTL